MTNETEIIDRAAGGERQPTRWWRNRRRWFFIGVTSLSLASIIGGSTWWYRANFPMPIWFWHILSIFPESNDWIRTTQSALLRWKFDRIAERFRFEGSVWENQISGGILEFGSDRKIRWRNRPNPSLLEPGMSKAALDRFDNLSYEDEHLPIHSFGKYESWTDGGGDFVAYRGLYFLGENDIWEVDLKYDGKRLTVEGAVFLDLKNPTSIAITFDRQIAP